MSPSTIQLHGRDHEHGGADPTHIVYEDVGGGASGGGGLSNAVMTKTSSQTVPHTGTYTQITLDPATFATTAATVFSASGSNITIAATGLYASWLYFQPDSVDVDQATTQLYTKWLTATTGGPNAPWERIVPRLFNVNGPAGLQGFMPDGAGLSLSMSSIGIAYCGGASTTASAFMAAFGTTDVTLSTCVHVVVQLQPIDAATLAAFPTFPF